MVEMDREWIKTGQGMSKRTPLELADRNAAWSLTSHPTMIGSRLAKHLRILSLQGHTAFGAESFRLASRTSALCLVKASKRW